MIRELTDRWVNIDGKYYINNESGRNKIREDYGEEFYNSLIEDWGNITQAPVEFIMNEITRFKYDELEEKFKSFVEGSFTTTEGYEMQFNVDDSLKMFGAIQLMENSGVEEGYLTDANDDTHYGVDIDVMKSVQNQMLQKYAEAHLLKQQYRALISAASDIDALNDIDIVFE